MSDIYINIPYRGSASWKAPVATAADLPTVGNNQGDARVTLDTDQIYIWTGAVWVNAATGNAGVTTLNGLTGGITLLAGPGISVTPSGQDIVITNTGGTGTVTSVSVVSANGFAGTVANPTSTPALTLTITVTGLLKGNGTTISAATPGTDYVIPSGSITGTAGNITATTNSTLTTLPSLSLPYSQITGAPSSVSSVGLALPSSVFTVSGSPVTSSGTLTGSLNTQTTNTFWAGPSSGAATAPTFRAIVAADLPSLSSTYVTQSEVGAANGVASLDGTGKVPIAQLPNAVFVYQGTWNPNTNTPTLVDGTGTQGFTYWVNAARATAVMGLNNPSMVNFNIGDLVLYNGTQYELTTPAAGVQSVNSSTGAIVLSVVSLNGLAGTYSGTALTLSTTITGLLKGNGTAISAATAGTDYVVPSGSITGTASNITATSNSTLTTLTALSLPGSQVSGNIPGDAANVTGTVAVANGGTGQTTAALAFSVNWEAMVWARVTLGL